MVAVRIVRDRATNIGRGIGYVLLRTKSVARAALTLAGATLGKRPLRVSRPTPRPAAAAAPAARVAFNKGEELLCRFPQRLCLAPADVFYAVGYGV